LIFVKFGANLINILKATSCKTNWSGFLGLPGYVQDIIICGDQNNIQLPF